MSAAAPSTKKREPGDLDRLRNVIVFFIAWALPAAGYVVGVLLTLWGLWSLAGWVFLNEGWHYAALWTVGGPLLVLIETGAEPTSRRWLALSWKNLIHRRNDILPWNQ